jgi:hypothetical protein
MPLNQGGGGDYLAEIIKKYEGYKFIAPLNFTKGNGILYKIGLALQTLVIRIIIIILTLFRLVDKLVIHHPQSLSYKFTSALINSANKIDYWVIDASFFCKKSYNSRNGESCIRCIEHFQPFDDCNHFPRFSNESSYINFLNSIEKNKEKINFIVQTDGYKKLILKRYGVKSKVEKVKMIINSFYLIKNEGDKKIEYDFGFHANTLEAKGYFYFLSLAKKNHKKIFFIPSKYDLDYVKYKNLVSKNLSWENGLKEELLKCRIIICPSLWLNTVEAGVIKSMLLGKPVALVGIENGFSEDLPENSFIKLTGNTHDDSIILSQYLGDIKALNRVGKKGKEWAKNYINDWN